MSPIHQIPSTFISLAKKLINTEAFCILLNSFYEYLEKNSGVGTKFGKWKKN